jgi:hypothetical protein
MKKFRLIAPLLLIASLFTACEADRDANPVINTNNTAAGSFTLNVPVQSNEYINLEDNTVMLTWSQPNFGFNAIATYRVQVGIKVGSDINWNVEKETNEPEFLLATYSDCKAEISGKDVAMAINEIDGLDDLANYTDKGFREIAFRIHASINLSSSEAISGTTFVSNAVTFKQMRSYPVIKMAGTIYLIGNCTEDGSWIAPIADNEEKLQAWILTETEIGNNIYEGTFDIPACDLEFRFYKTLEGWGEDSSADAVLGSLGSGLKDNTPYDFQFDESGEYTDGNIQPGKGTWKCAKFPGGKVKFTVDLNTNTVKFTKLAS